MIAERIREFTEEYPVETTIDLDAIMVRVAIKERRKQIRRLEHRRIDLIQTPSLTSEGQLEFQKITRKLTLLQRDQYQDKQYGRINIISQPDNLIRI